MISRIMTKPRKVLLWILVLLAFLWVIGVLVGDDEEIQEGQSKKYRRQSPREPIQFAQVRLQKVPKLHRLILT